MATYSVSVRTVRTIEYSVPADNAWGACYAEIDKAFAGILQDLRRFGVLGKDESPSDDLVRVFPRDDEIVLVAQVQSSSTGSFTDLMNELPPRTSGQE